MPADRFFIAPYDKNSGLMKNVKPFLIPDEAFAQLNNAYVFRGRVRKRFGSRWLGDTQLLSRLRINVATTAVVSGNLAATIMPGIIWKIGQMFSVGTTIFTVYQANGATLTTGAATATYNTATGSLVITGNATNPATAVYFYPAEPVMGLVTYENANISNEPTYAFDTQFAYQYTAGWERLNGEVVGGAALWSGSNSEFFWGATWSGANAADKVLYVTNFNETEANFMRSFFAAQWNNFRPQVSATEYLNSARILVPFKNRLLAFNTWESVVAAPPGTNYQNRVRYSAIGSPLAANAWRQDIAGNGNGLDCPTTEAVITVEFVKDRLIVFFERSTWELVYTGNQIYPFAWQQINTELGAESTFSVVPFDKVALGVGNVGIHACDGSNVERIDNNIPDVVFAIHNTDSGVERVFGIRDFYVEHVYWTMPSSDQSATFPYPNQVLVYNYKAGTWAFNDDSITAFGYFQPQTGILWSSPLVTFSDAVGWGSGPAIALFRQVVAGNQEGYTFIIDADIPTNASVLQITNITIAVAGSNILTIACIDHNLREGDYVYFQDITGTGNLNLLNDKIFAVLQGPTANAFTISYLDSIGSIIAGVYSGAGTISRVSRINILTKEYNFYQQDGRNAYISKVDFLVDKTAFGEIQVNYYVSSSGLTMVEQSDATGTGSLVGTSVLETSPYATVPFENLAERLWHCLYFQGDGEYIQFQLILTDAQMESTEVRISPFELHALCITAQPTSQRLQ